MTDQDVSKDKAAEVAPYLITNKKDKNDISSKTNRLVPVIIILVVAIVIVASFFEDEYKSLMAGFNPEANTGEEVITAETPDSTIGNNVETPVANTYTLETKKPVELMTTSLDTTVNTQVTITAAATPTTSQPGLITVYNPYLRPYPQVYAPIPPQLPYAMPPKQAKAYTEMIQKRQKAVAEMIEMRNAAMLRMEKNRMERIQRIEQQRAQAQKTYVEMLKRRQEANRI